MMSKKNIKEKSLRMLSKNSEAIFPDLKDFFICPTCLDKIPLKESHMVSEAHIIPKAAGGKLKTYICKDCNSRFGAKQDKWFGELVRMSKEDTPSVFFTKFKKPYFMIDDIKLNGHWEADKNKGFTFYINKGRNSPTTINRFMEKVNNKPPSYTLTLSFPIKENKRMITMGFLTAGYLMWFYTLGYSWAFQRHLDQIREQIQNPEKDILKINFMGSLKNDIKMKPNVGILSIKNEAVLAFGFLNFFVLFPSQDCPQRILNNANDLSGEEVSDFLPLQFPHRPSYGPSIVLSWENRVLVAPDALISNDLSPLVIHLSDGCKKSEFLFPVSKKKYNELQNKPGVITKELTISST